MYHDILSNEFFVFARDFVIIAVSGWTGYFVGILKERNYAKWKENREALQCCYAYFDVLIMRMKENIPMSESLFKQLNDLKYNKNFNILNQELFKKIRTLLESPIYDIRLQKYNEEIKEKFISDIENLLPILKKEMEKVIFLQKR